MNPCHDIAREEDFGGDGDQAEIEAVAGDGGEKADNETSAHVPDQVHAQAPEAGPVASSCSEMEDSLAEGGCNRLVLDEEDLRVGGVLLIGWLGRCIVGGRIDGLNRVDGHVCCRFRRLDHAKSRNQFAVGVADLYRCQPCSIR